MSYTSDTIFGDARINAVCDFLVKKLFEQFPPGEGDDADYIYQRVILSGRAAALLHDDSDGEIRNITFITDVADIYKWCVENISSLFFDCRAIAFTDRILFNPDSYYFELWFSSEELKDSVSVGDNVYIQELISIPEDTL
jgi:hypothetical protein